MSFWKWDGDSGGLLWRTSDDFVIEQTSFKPGDSDVVVFLEFETCSENISLMYTSQCHT